MKLLLIESAGDGLLDLAIRAKVAGHEVRYHCGSFDAVRNPCGRGLVERVADWRGCGRWADLIVCGSTRWMRELDALRERGIPVIGGSEPMARLELDRLAGMAAFKRAGIAVPPFRKFDRIDAAILYVASHDNGFAVKPCGDVADKSLSFVGKSGRDVVWRLESWKRQGKRFPEGFIVQDKIEGVEFAVGAWVAGNGFVPGWEENFEEKRMFPGGGGPNTGELGTVMRLTRQSKLAKAVLAPFEDWLVGTGYRGNVDVNCIVDDSGTAWPLEWTGRLGWPAFNIETALHDGDPIEFLAGVAGGKAPATRRMDEVAVGVVMALPPYPHGHEKPGEVVGVPIWDRGRSDGVHYVNAAMGALPAVEGGKVQKMQGLVTAGSYVCVVTGSGETVQQARRNAYARTESVHMPADDFHRPDIGARLARQLPDLQAHGYAMGIRFS